MSLTGLYTTLLSVLASVIFRVAQTASDRLIAVAQALYFPLYSGKCMPALTAKSVNRTGKHNPLKVAVDDLLLFVHAGMTDLF